MEDDFEISPKNEELLVWRSREEHLRQREEHLRSQRDPEGVAQSEDGVMWQERVWGPEWQEMRLGSQVLARMGVA